MEDMKGQSSGSLDYSGSWQVLRYYSLSGTTTSKPTAGAGQQILDRDERKTCSAPPARFSFFSPPAEELRASAVQILGPDYDVSNADASWNQTPVVSEQQQVQLKARTSSGSGRGARKTLCPTQTRLDAVHHLTLSSLVTTYSGVGQQTPRAFAYRGGPRALGRPPCQRRPASQVPIREGYYPPIALSPEPRPSHDGLVQEGEAESSTEALLEVVDAQEMDKKEQEDMCAVCGGNSSVNVLVDCNGTGCGGRWYHLDCHIPQLREEPDGDRWKCQLCTDDASGYEKEFGVPRMNYDQHRKCLKLLLKIYCLPGATDVHEKLNDTKQRLVNDLSFECVEEFLKSLKNAFVTAALTPKERDWFDEHKQDMADFVKEFFPKKVPIFGNFKRKMDKVDTLEAAKLKNKKI